MFYYHSIDKRLDFECEKYFEKQEKAKEIAKLEQAISNSKAELSHVVYQQFWAKMKRKR